MIIVTFIAAVVLLIAVVGFLITKSGWALLVGVLALLVGIGFWIWSAYYDIQPGEAKVLKSWSGILSDDYEDVQGPHWKSPFEDAIDFDVRNQIAVFLGDGNQSYDGNPSNGPQITFADKDKLTGNLDIAVRYSIIPSFLPDLVEDYQNQKDFETKVILQDVRAVPREITGQFTTAQMLTEKGAVANAILDALKTDWEAKGVVIEDVSLQDVRYPTSVMERFDAAQNAATAVVEAKQNALAAEEKAKGEANAAIERARGEATANDLLTKSLTPEVLQQRYLDTLKELAAAGNLIITDGTSPNVMVQR